MTDIYSRILTELQATIYTESKKNRTTAEKVGVGKNKKVLPKINEKNKRQRWKPKNKFTNKYNNGWYR